MIIISSKDLIDYALSLGLNALFFDTRDEVRQYILKEAKQGDRIVIMGARDNTLPDFCRDILEGLK